MLADKIFLETLTEDGGIQFGQPGGYWSNLDREENRRYLKECVALGARGVVKQFFPKYFDIIFSPKRAAGLPLFDLSPNEIVVDVGCMWGALTIPLAKAGCRVVAVDQTLESLLLLKQRLIDDKLENTEIVCCDLNKTKYRDSSVDKFVVNGVLEWIPETGNIELTKYYGKKVVKKGGPCLEPGGLQVDFLKNLNTGLKEGGRLYLGIENRFNFFHLLGTPDPHCNIRFITFMPRRMQDIISRVILGRPYLNWTYSETSLRKILAKAGFRDINIYYAFPDYRFPEYILTSKGLRYYRPNLCRKGRKPAIKAICYLIEDLLFRKFKLGFFSPSFIAIAKK